jgi:hypothetical protein
VIVFAGFPLIDELVQQVRASLIPIVINSPHWPRGQHESTGRQRDRSQSIDGRPVRKANGPPALRDRDITLRPVSRNRE